jgi:hypothetical protein
LPAAGVVVMCKLAKHMNTTALKIKWSARLLVNGPVLLLLVGPLYIFHGLAKSIPILSIALFIVGFILAWAWWSVAVSYWRKHWHRQGVEENIIQIYGEHSGILWPPGHLLEKTEFDNLIKRWRS